MSRSKKPSPWRHYISCRPGNENFSEPRSGNYKSAKKQTHRIERLQGKKVVDEMKKEID